MAIRLNGLHKFLNKFKKLDEDKIIAGIIGNATMKDEIIYEITQKQLYEKGIDGDGKSLGEYSKNTIYGTSRFEGKISKGQRFDHVTLNDTGAFYESFDVKADSQDVTISADDEKGDVALTEKYGPKILTLTNESKKVLKPQIAGFYIQAIRNAVKR